MNGGIPVDGCAFAKPDLTASFLRLDTVGTERRLTVRIGNAGNAVAGAGVPVSFYDGNPLLGGLKLATTALSANLAAGSFEDVELLVPDTTTTTSSVWVVADDFGGLIGSVSESDEDNNAFDSGLSLIGAVGGLADLAIVSVDTEALSVDESTLASSGTLTATVRNQGELAVTGPFDVVFFEDANANGTYESGVDVELGVALVDGASPLDVGASVAAETSASGTVAFAGNLIYAFADSGLVVTESNEDNNVSSSGADSVATLSGGASDITEEWSWTSSSTQPAYRNISTTPVVGDLTGDGVSDIVFVTFRAASTSVGYLRAVDGATRQELFTADDFDWRVYGLATPAIGDLDGNGDLDIVAIDDSRRHVMAFEWNTASSQLDFKWKSASLPDAVNLGAVSIADLEGDGQAEILFGRQVLESDGTLRFSGSSTRRGHLISSLSVAVDLDDDGVLEVVTGDVAYTATGAVHWDLGIADGFVAVGNFDTDPEPELVHLNPNPPRLRVLEHDGTVKWGPVTVPGNGLSAPPTVADVDADGRAEIIVATRDLLTVYETGGFVRWSVPITHTASVRNAGAVAAAFDFDGDGASELVYHDETGIHIYSGRDGSVVDEELLPSCHRSVGYVTVADVDGDGAAELIAGFNDTCAASTNEGLHIFGDAGGNWVRTRAIWNQHNYHVTNVDDDGGIPLNQVPSWTRNNSFRHQVLTSGSIFAAADLTASFGRVSEVGTDIVITVRIGNGGAAIAPAGVPVSLYNGNPALGFPFLATVNTTSTLAPGSFEDVSFQFPSITLAEDTLYAVADDDATMPLAPVGIVVESDEDNNAHDTGLALNLEPVVGAGEDVALDFPDATTTLQGSVSDDGLPLGAALTVMWQVVLGPLGSDVNPPLFVDQTAPGTDVTFQVAGAYVLRLVADDSRRIGSDEVTVLVGEENLPPVVDAGPDADVELPNTVLTMAASVTDDGLPLGAFLDIHWTQISGPGVVSFVDTANPTTDVTFPVAGTYILSIQGREVLATSDSVVITVHPLNQGPSVSAGSDQTIFSPTTILQGSASDADGLPVAGSLTTTWSQVSAPGPVMFTDVSDVGTSVSFGATGTYVFRLTANDGAIIATDDVTIEVDITNAPPLVQAGPDQTIVFPTSSTTLSGTVTDDGLPGGSSVSVVWNLLSAPAAVVFGDQFNTTTSVSFTAGGTYLFRLDASDTDLLGNDTVTVVVDDGNVAPAPNAGADQNILLPTNTVTLNGSATDDGLPSGSVLTYDWTTASGPALADFQSPSAPTTVVTFEQAGTFVLRLTVGDGLLSVSDEVTVVVDTTPPGPAPLVAILSPTERATITDFTDVVGTVTSSDLLSWRLEAREVSATEFVRIATDTVEVTAATLGQFDPTLAMNGLYELRLTATDNAGQTVAVSVFVVVKENLKIGHFTVSFVDLEVPVSGLPIRITRTYDSRDKKLGDFGFGWRMDLATIDVAENSTLGLSWSGEQTFGGLGQFCVRPTKPGVVTVTMPGGEVFEFEPVFNRECGLVPPLDGTISFRPLPGTNATLEPVDGNFVYVAGSFPEPIDPPSTLFLFDPSFNLYDPDVYRLTLPDGRAFVIDQEEGVKSITDLNGNELTITDDGITHSSGKAVDFQRDSEGRVESIIDPNGNPMFYAYDSQGDLVSYTDRENNETTFTYLTAVTHHLDGIVDPRGIMPIRNDYDPATGRLIRHTDAFGNTIEYTHQIGVRQEEILDRNGKLRVLEYDERGNVVLETDPNGKVILRAYDANNNKTCETEAHDPAQSGVDCQNSPNPVLFAYDARDNILSQTDAEGNTTSFTYNVRDQIETTTDPKSQTTTNVYDAQGNLTKIIDVAGTETDFTNDAQGNVKTQSVSVGGVAHTTSFDYDVSGNLTRETDAAGNETTFTYDANGNRLTETRTRTLPDTSVATLVTNFVYDKLGRVVSTTDTDGSFTRTVYDTIGKQKEIFDKLGRKTAFEYDEMGQLSKITYPDTTTEEFNYDNEGLRLTSKDRGSRTTAFEYDDLGRLTKTTFPDVTSTQNVYDDGGRLEQTIDARGKITRFEYDAAGRRKKAIDPLLNETEFFYDANRNQTSIKDPNGQITTFEYDALNRRTKTIFPDTTFTQTDYDELGRRIRETDQAGVQIEFEYDTLGRLTKVIQDAGGLALETTYGYDEVGNRISQTDANVHTTTFGYDALGRETRRTLPGGTFETKAYDAAGNLKTWTKFDGSVIMFSYDINNRLILKDFPTGTDVTFNYTPTGRRDTVTDARGTTDYAYDVRDRLQTLTYPDGRKLDYTYDANGSRTSLTATIGSAVLTTTYSYDNASRLDIVTDPNLGTYDHDYDPNGNRAALAYPNGTNTSYQHDTLNRLTDLTTTGSSGSIQSYQFTLGPAGNREQIDEADGTTRAYDYDNLYRLTRETVTHAVSTLGYEKSFGYDDVGNREAQTTTGLGAGTIDYTYDDRDRLLTENATTYGYDADGNLTTKSGEATYTWDFEDRLIRIDKNDGIVVEHVYDTDGVRVRTTTTPGGSPSLTDFLVDTSGSLSHVVAESDGAGVFQAYYVRGDDFLSIIRPTEQRYYHADGLGSIRVLTDESGNITDSYTYTAFGEELSHVGTDVQPYQFAGEPFDPNIGFHYNRARWLDPTVGRFVSSDGFMGIASDPLSLHKYSYARFNPANNVDSSGFYSTGAGVVLTLGLLTKLQIATVVLITVIGVVCTALPVLAAVRGKGRGCTPRDDDDDEKVLEFVHGTDVESAESIVKDGIRPVSVRDGSFFTFALTSPHAREFASDFAVNRAGNSLDARLVIMTLPEKIFEQLKVLGQVQVNPIFLGNAVQTEFLFTTFPLLNSVGIFRIEPIILP